ncbi:hypothetical protein GIB67_035003 [Kingdonia uniflora]|uniref:NADH:quinone oxidoreductase/Mrp antiporter transmembrane domain-containing protein n=1 Tax=Kingdonia uniflora TaxID=39325 RepID=A0A7J7M3S0_9MAGN|nr:hypothetical protein GIB67_035003 [Kingdonia uniflora]
MIKINQITNSNRSKCRKLTECCDLTPQDKEAKLLPESSNRRLGISFEDCDTSHVKYWKFIMYTMMIDTGSATLGGILLCGANDLITIFVAPECFSLCSYLLSGYTKRDVRSNEATTKYLLMGGASSSILVHGFSWLYGSSGGEIELQEIVNGLINTQMYNSPGISIALIFITVGIGFKLSPAPSHQWTPDVYEGVRFVQ